MTASYASLNERRAIFDYHITASEFDIQKAYKEIKLFREMATAAGKASGTVSLDYQLSGTLNDSMYPILPSLKGGGVLSLKKIKVKGLKLFSAISEKTGKEGIQNPDLSKVDIKTKINRNIITIERFKLRVAGFRPRFEGQVSFDGRLNLKGRLGLPPFGIFGIPLSITGTQTKPIVRLHRSKASDELEEKDEDDEKQ
jgi:AsmA protein